MGFNSGFKGLSVFGDLSALPYRDDME